MERQNPFATRKIGTPLCESTQKTSLVVTSVWAPSAQRVLVWLVGTLQTDPLRWPVQGFCAVGAAQEILADSYSGKAQSEFTLKTSLS